MTEVKKKAGRGRPCTGNAKTSTERVKELDAALLALGGRVLNRVRLSAEAVHALAALSELDGSERAAKFPNIAKHGVVTIITAKRGNVVYQINERSGQKYDRPMRAFEN